MLHMYPQWELGQPSATIRNKFYYGCDIGCWLATTNQDLPSFWMPQLFKVCVSWFFWALQIARLPDFSRPGGILTPHSWALSHHSHGSHVLSDAAAVICQGCGKMSKNIWKQKKHIIPPECIFPSWCHVDTPGIMRVLKMLGPVSLTSCSWNFELNHLGTGACNIWPWNMCGPTS